MKQALKDAPYQHINRPNKNLIHDDDIDVKTQLEKRLLTSQLISRRLSNFNQDQDEVNYIFSYIELIYVN